MPELLTSQFNSIPVNPQFAKYLHLVNFVSMEPLPMHGQVGCALAFCCLHTIPSCVLSAACESQISTATTVIKQAQMRLAAHLSKHVYCARLCVT